MIPLIRSAGKIPKKEPPPILISPREVAQMREKKRQLAALRKMIADREGRTDGR